MGVIRPGPAQLRARLGAAFTARLSPEHTRRATLFERLTVQRLSWDVLVRIHRHLELIGKLANGDLGRLHRLGAPRHGFGAP